MPVQGTASDVGHGALGLRTMPGRSFLRNTSAYEKHTWLECRPVRPIFGWTLETGATWRAPCAITFLNVVLDVIWTKTSQGRLSRKETLVKCVSVPGTYFFDPDASAADWLWDDGSLWDAEPVWDADPVLYVHLFDDGDPNEINVDAVLGVFVGNYGVPQPTLHREDALVDGSFEEFGGRGDPFAEWSEDTSGSGYSVDRTTIDVMDGLVAAALTATAGSAGGFAGVSQEMSSDVVVHGKTYWAGGWYKTGEANPFGLDAALMVGDYSAGEWVRPDGRTYGSAEPVLLPPTYGEWHRAVFVFVMPPGSAAGELGVHFRLVNDTGGDATGAAYFDGWKVRRVLRMNDYHPWLPSGGVPTVQVSRPDAYFGEWAIGLGAFRFLNHSRALDPLFSIVAWVGQEILVRGGGRFPGQGGQEVLFDDLSLEYVAMPKRVDLSDTDATIPVRDLRETLKLELPIDTYGLQNYPGVEARFRGRPIPIIYGIANNLTPTRTDLAVTTFLPVYDVASNARLDEGSPSLRFYESEDAAEKGLAGTYTSPTSSEWDIDGGGRGFRMNEHPGPIRIEAGVNDMLDVNADGNVREVLLTPGLYRMTANGNTTTGIIPHVESKLDALPDADFSVSVGSDWKTIIGYGGVSLTLLIDSGVNKHRSAWKTLGFTGKDDLSGLDLTGDTALYVPEEDADAFVCRVSGVHGQHDDSAGTYTGSPDALIELPGDVIYHVLRGILLFDPTQVDAEAVAAARVVEESAEPVDVVIGGLSGGKGSRLPLKTLFTRLENGAKLDVLLKTTTWTLQPRDSVAPADIPTIEDRDFLAGSWRSWLEDKDVYYVVRVLYGEDPSTGAWASVEGNPNGTDYVPLNHGRWEDVNFHTYLRNYSAVLNRLASFLSIAVAPIRHFAFRVRGKAFEVPPGGKVLSNRTHGMTDPSGLNEPVQMRILSKVDASETQESEIEAMTDVG